MCFFSPLTRPAVNATLNPGVGAGLPHSILAWAQDCPRCFPENAGSAVLYSYAPRLAARIARKTPAVRRYTPMHSRTRRPDCPENSVSVLLCGSALTEKLRRCRKYGISPGLTALPGFKFGQVTQRKWGRSSCFLRQSIASDLVVPLVPCTGIFKTVALISLILEQYRGVFKRIYVFSPSVNIDDGWIPVKKYIEGDLGVNTEREQTYWDEWDEAALRRIIQQQRKITEASKKLEMKKLYQVLVVIDDFADTPQLHKPHGALQISTWVSSQKLRLISAAVRVNMQFLCCRRLRNQHKLDAVIEELSALLPKEQLYRLYEQATREPCSFLFVYYLKPRNEMFYKRFEERFVIENADGSGAQLPGPEGDAKISPAAPPSQQSSRPSFAERVAFLEKA